MIILIIDNYYHLFYSSSSSSNYNQARGESEMVNTNFFKDNFYLSDQDEPQKIYEANLHHLIHDEKELKNFFALYGKGIKAKGNDVVAAYFSSWFGYVCAGVQYIATYYHTKLALSLEDITVQLFPHPQYKDYWIHFKIRKLASISQNETNEELVSLDDFIQNIATPVIKVFAVKGNLRPQHLWSQVINAVFWSKKKWVENEERQNVKDKIEHEFNEFLALPSRYFDLNKNPFTLKLTTIDNPWNPEQPLWLKPSCCLAYRTESKPGYCYTCPRMKESEREERKLKILAEAARQA